MSEYDADIVTWSERQARAVALRGSCAMVPQGGPRPIGDPPPDEDEDDEDEDDDEDDE